MYMTNSKSTIILIMWSWPTRNEKCIRSNGINSISIIKSQFIIVIILDVYLYGFLKQRYDVYMYMLICFVKGGSKSISLGSRKLYSLLQLRHLVHGYEHNFLYCSYDTRYWI